MNYSLLHAWDTLTGVELDRLVTVNCDDPAQLVLN